MHLNHGFLPETLPLSTLPVAFQEWESCARQLPKLLLSSHIRKTIAALPPFPIKLLTSTAEQERGMLLLSFIGHAYVWGCPPVVDSIPAVLAKPWCELATILQRPPILSYASYALHNWTVFDKTKPIALGNIALLQNFLGGIDEEWFILIHIDIEEKAAQALNALLPLQKAAQEGNTQKGLLHLTQIEDSLKKMCETLERMPEHCDPYIYYHRVRPYIHGWKNNPSLPNGLIYESCFDEKPQFFRGETGAQSSIIPALDAVFGIKHKPDVLGTYLQEMRQYMPYEHRAFLNAVEKQSDIRNWVAHQAKTQTELKDIYNQCIDYLVRFRTTHLKYAASYIHKQSQDSAANPTSVGTGGTPFMEYLSKHERETETFKI